MNHFWVTYPKRLCWLSEFVLGFAAIPLQEVISFCLSTITIDSLLQSKNYMIAGDKTTEDFIREAVFLNNNNLGAIEVCRFPVDLNLIIQSCCTFLLTQLYQDFSLNFLLSIWASENLHELSVTDTMRAGKWWAGVKFPQLLRLCNSSDHS